jgi:hypothetical protein
VTAAAAERLPTPLAVDGVVAIDTPSRTLAVRLSESAGGYEQHLWREAHGALSREQDSGWRGATSTVWCSAPGQRNIMAATAGDFQMLLARFRPGESAYTELVGRPRLYAIVTMDRELARFLAVKFLHRPVYARHPTQEGAAALG